MSNDAIDTVADVPNGDNWGLVTGAHERNHVLQHIGESPEDWAHGSLFVKTGDAEYTDVLFFSGNVPKLSKSVTRLR